MSARIRQFLITICEWLHAAMVLAPLAGVLYMLLKERNDSYIPVMYAIALGLLLPANMILRTAVMKAKSLWLYLIVTAAVLTGVFAAAASWSGAYFEGTVRIYLWIVLTVQTVILALDCFGIRMEDNRRRQAVLENDRLLRLFNSLSYVFLTFLTLVYLCYKIISNLLQVFCILVKM